MRIQSTREFQTFIHVLSLCGIAVGLGLGKAVISLSLLVLSLNFLLTSNYAEYWRNLKSNKLFRLITALYVLHLLGMFWSSDISYGLHDLKVKIPLFAIPLILAAKPLESKNHVHFILISLLVSILVSSLINFGTYQQWFGSKEYDDIRGMSLFGSHIRYSLLVSFSVGICFYFLLNYKYYLLFVPLILWLSFYTLYSQVLSGIATLSAVYCTIILYLLWNNYRILAIALLSFIIANIMALGFWIMKPIGVDPSDYTNLPTQTISGNYYSHRFDHISPETGHPINIYVCDKELREQWNRASELDYDGFDKRDQILHLTLIRYMASLNLHKDSVGFSLLSLDDIKNVENGVASSYNFGLMARLYALKYQVNNEDNPNGHSFLERIEFWKTGTSILMDNPLFGVGTGDVQKAFNAKYDLSNSKLYPENRNRGHNMFLTISLTLGLPALLLFLYVHVQFIKLNLKKKEVVAILFIAVVLVSYLIEDTLETQTGVTFFSLFFGIYSSSFLGRQNSDV